MGAKNFGTIVGSSQKLHRSIIGTSWEPLRASSIDKYVGEFVDEDGEEVVILSIVTDYCFLVRDGPIDRC